MTWNARLPLIWIALIFTLMVISLGFLFPDRLKELHTHWTTADDLDLGYFLLLVFFYFTYKNTSYDIGKSNYYFLPLTCLISISFFVAQALDLKTLFFINVAFTFPLFIAVSLGWKKTKELLIPWAILMMAMPFWYLAISVLQEITVKAVSQLASLISLTVLVEGNYFTISTGVVHVAGGCSGLKYFMTSITLALISSALNKRNIKFTFLSIIIAALLAMIGNWIRVFILLLVAYYQGIDHPLMADHDTLGWIVFACVMIPWFIIDKRLDSPAFKTTTQPESNASDQVFGALSQKQNKNQYSRIIAFGLSFAIFFITQLIISPPLIDSTTDYQIEFPAELNDMQFSSIAPSNWKPNYPEPNKSIAGNYYSGFETFDIYILSYLFGSKAEMANKTNTIFDEQNWILVSDTPWQSETDSKIKIRIAIGKSGKEYRVVYYWYKHGERFANTIIESKLAQLQGIFKRVESTQLIAVSKICNIKCQQNVSPNKATEEFIRELNKHTRLITLP